MNPILMQHGIEWLGETEGQRSKKLQSEVLLYSCMKLVSVEVDAREVEEYCSQKA
ncbi:hypothetical protein EV207_101131 [Scopulibacillus darangshiensis]|uniref:Uncharacterized protein n=1 Tax=Scopulibacillus darangshiensis TaxID=442528 RepID=A0A4R2PAP4_9BACL|nr:hypothetical protein [Scopulibacillus darangshiensis]TCP32153.1 hypothetical protein EV207_101131 [Scopulibacillus darangshiensis]